MRLEGDALGVHGAQLGQRHHLKAAGIGQDRTWPVHHAVQPAKAFHPLGAGAQHQVVGVAQHHRRPGGAHRVGGHRLHRAGGADRHEHRRFHRAVRGVQHAGPRGAVARDDVVAERGGRGACDHGRSSRQASP
jgi:hypothetical protein